MVKKDKYLFLPGCSVATLERRKKIRGEATVNGNNEDSNNN